LSLGQENETSRRSIINGILKAIVWLDIGVQWNSRTPLKGHFCLGPKSVIIVLHRTLNKGHLCIKDRNKFPNKFPKQLREVPLYLTSK